MKSILIELIEFPQVGYTNIRTTKNGEFTTNEFIGILEFVKHREINSCLESGEQKALASKKRKKKRTTKQA